MNAKSLLTASILIILLFASSLIFAGCAATPSSGQSFQPFGNANTILTSFWNILAQPVNMPAIAANTGGTQPLVLILGAIVMFFSIIYMIAITNLPFFKNDNARGAAMAFSLALSAIAVLGTNFINWLIYLLDFSVNGFGLIGGLAIIIGFFLFIYMIFGKGFSSYSGIEKGIGDSRKIHRDTVMGNKQLGAEQAEFNNLENLLRTQLNNVMDLENYLKSLKSNVSQIPFIRDVGQVKTYKDSLIRSLSNVMPRLQKSVMLNEKRVESIRKIDALTVSTLKLSASANDIAIQIKNLATAQGLKATANNDKSTQTYAQDIKNQHIAIIAIRNKLDGLSAAITALENELTTGFKSLNDNLYQNKWRESMNDIENLLLTLEKVRSNDTILIGLDTDATNLITQLKGEEGTLNSLTGKKGFK